MAYLEKLVIHSGDSNIAFYPADSSVGLVLKGAHILVPNGSMASLYVPSLEVSGDEALMEITQTEKSLITTANYSDLLTYMTEFTITPDSFSVTTEVRNTGSEPTSALMEINPRFLTPQGVSRIELNGARVAPLIDEGRTLIIGAENTLIIPGPIPTIQELHLSQKGFNCAAPRGKGRESSFTLSLFSTRFRNPHEEFASTSRQIQPGKSRRSMLSISIG